MSDEVYNRYVRIISKNEIFRKKSYNKFCE